MGVVGVCRGGMDRFIGCVWCRVGMCDVGEVGACCLEEFGVEHNVVR